MANDGTKQTVLASAERNRSSTSSASTAGNTPADNTGDNRAADNPTPADRQPQSPIVLAQATNTPVSDTSPDSTSRAARESQPQKVRDDKVDAALDYVSDGDYRSTDPASRPAARLAGVITGKQLPDLTAAERAQVLEQQSMRWTYGRFIMGEGAQSLSELPAQAGASTNPQVRRDIATAYMNAATLPKDQQPFDFTDVGSTAALALRTDPGAAMQALTSKPDAITNLASATAKVAGPGAVKLFDALSATAPSPERDLLIRTTFLKTNADAIGRDRNLQAATANALAATQFPNDPTKAAATARDISALLGIESGRALLADTNVNPAARLWALDRAAADPAALSRLTGNADKPWEQPALVEAHGRARFEQFAAGRGDASVPLPGTNLENMIGAGMNAPPRADAPKTDAELSAASELARAGKYSFYEGFDPVKKPADGIREADKQMGGAGAQPRVAFIPVQYSSQDTGPVDFTLYRVDGANGQSRYVDNEGRIYNSVDHWRKDSRLPPGVMTYPEGGRFDTQAGPVKLVTGATPKTIDSTRERVLNVLDKATMVGGVIAGGALIFVSGGTAALVLGGIAIGSGAYQSGRAAGDLIDRAKHGQSISLTDPDARAAWLSVGAGGLAVAGGAASALARTAGNGTNLATQSARAAGILNTSANLADVGAVVDQGANLALNWNKLSPQERAQIGLNMAFWGSMTVASTRASGAQMRDMFDFRAQVNRSLIDTGAAVARQPTLQGDAVQVKYTQGPDGRLSAINIEYGPKARTEDIHLHQQTAHAMLGADGLRGLLDGNAARTGEPKPGTMAWEARHEVGKISTALERDVKLLNSGKLTADQRSDLQARVTDYRAELAYQRVIAERMLEAPGLGAVALPSAGSQRAQELGLPKTRDGYHWAMQGDQPIVRSNPDNIRREPLVYNPVTRGFDPVDPNVVRSTTTGPTQSVTIGDGAVQTRIDAELARREVYRDEVQTLEDKRDKNGGTLSARDDARLRGAYAGRAQASEQVGELGALAAVRERVGADASPIYGGPGQGPGRPGTFDQVWELPPTQPGGPTRLLVVEAKGGSAELGTRQIGLARHEQGTSEYLKDVISSMRGDPATRDLARRLEAARRDGTLEYVLAKTPIKDQASGLPTAAVVNWSTFEVR